MRSPLARLSVVVVLLWVASDNASAQNAAFHFVANACEERLATLQVTCGTISVPEDYALPQGRKIHLNVFVVHALESSNARSAQFDLEGGPGFAATESVEFYVGEGAAYRHTRDVVLADMRGTGASNPLRCNAIEATAHKDPLSSLYPVELVRQCADSLASLADVRQYTTQNAARDIESIRLALGYDQWDLNAVSYGTTLALRYTAEYPSHVRSAVLTGAVPADKTPPRFHASAAMTAFNQIFDKCRRDSDCAKQFPDVPLELQRAFAILTPSIRPLFMEKLRTMLYMAPSSRRVPLEIHKVATGDISLLTESAGSRMFADGLYLSITCSESFAKMNIEKSIRVADKTAFTAYRLRRQAEACKQWPTGPVDAQLFAQPKSGVPVLFISGQFDPVTPSTWTSALQRKFSHSVHVVVPGGGHVMEGMDGLETCLDPLVLKFVERLVVQQADWSCVSSMDAGPFALH